MSASILIVSESVIVLSVSVVVYSSLEEISDDTVEDTDVIPLFPPKDKGILTKGKVIKKTGTAIHIPYMNFLLSLFPNNFLMDKMNKTIRLKPIKP